MSSFRREGDSFESPNLAVGEHGVLIEEVCEVVREPLLGDELGNDEPSPWAESREILESAAAESYHEGAFEPRRRAAAVPEPLEVDRIGRNSELSPRATAVERSVVSTPNVDSDKLKLETVIALARILERVERSTTAVDADQYQVIVARLKAALSEDLPADALQAVLGAHPSAAELYENMHYEHSGLSRSSLERSVSSEMLATQVLARAVRGSRSSPGSGG